MAVDGTWKLVVNTPMGPHESTLTLSSSGSTLTGSQSAGTGGEGRQIEEGTVNGNDIAWKASITKPMPLTLEFSGTVEGDKLTGEVKLGMFGKGSFTGTRV